MFSISHISTHDGMSGAGKSAFKLFRAMEKKSFNNKMVVLKKHTKNPNVISAKNLLPTYIKFLGIFLVFIHRIFNKLLSKNSHNFSIGIFPGLGQFLNKILQSDIYIIRWTQGGYVQISDLSKLNRPIILVLSDECNMTGGCHYSGTCQNFKKDCIKCPELSFFKNTIAYKSQLKKKEVVKTLKNLTVVSPSHWLTNRVKSSSIFRKNKVLTINTGVDHTIFKPYDLIASRNNFNFNFNDFIICFGSVGLETDTRKGYKILFETIELLKEKNLLNQVSFICFGNEDKNLQIKDINLISLGYINDVSLLAKVYSASDIFLAPSIEENFANTCLESLSCGTPVVAFSIGGMPEIIDHKLNGFLCADVSSNSLFDGIKWFLDNKGAIPSMREKARTKILKKFTLETQAEKYETLIKRVLCEKN